MAWQYLNKPVLLVLFIYPACDGHEKVYAMHCCTTYTTPKPIYKCIYTPWAHKAIYFVWGFRYYYVMCMYHDSFFTPLNSTVEFELSEVQWSGGILLSHLQCWDITRQRHHKSESKRGLKPRRFLEKFSPRYFCKVQLWKWSQDKFIFISLFLCVFQTTPLHLRISNWSEQKNYTLATKCLETPPRPWKSSQRSRDLWKMSSSSSTSSRRQRQVLFGAN